MLISTILFQVSMKPMDFSCILRVSNAQQNENGFKDVLIDSIYGSLLEYLSTESHSLCFADIVLPVSICLKKFLKQNKVANFCRKMRQVVDKIEENVKFIENEKKAISFELSDKNAVEAWEKSVQVKGTPLNSYYQAWNKVNAFNEEKKKTEKINIGDSIAEMMKKRKTLGKNKSDEGPVDLLPSDESDDEDFFGGDSEEREVKSKSKKQLKKQKLGMNKSGEGLFTSLPSDESDDESHVEEQEKRKPKKRALPQKSMKATQIKKKKSKHAQTSGDDAETVDVVQDMSLSEW